MTRITPVVLFFPCLFSALCPCGALSGQSNTQARISTGLVSVPAVDSIEPIGPNYPWHVIPGRVLAGGREQLISRVGKDFLEKYITLDSDRCEYWQGHPEERGKIIPITKAGLLSFTPHWTLRYQLKMPEKPWVAGPIEVYVDSNGIPIKEAAIEGIGDCAADPSECLFSIDREMALQIARDRGLEEGIRPWFLVAKWIERPLPRFVWHVLNTISVASNGCTSHGHMVLIDANTGQVVSFQDFDVICDVARKRNSREEGVFAPGR